jgi:hypothetical protein
MSQETAMIPKSEWKWYGYAGHFVGGKMCAYHLATRIGQFFVSTVGDYYPDAKTRERLGADAESWFETFVFRCNGEDGYGNPNVDFQEIDSRRYADSLVAENGHYEFCEKYARLGSQ